MQVVESKLYTRSTGSYVTMDGGRTLYLRLEAGDTVTMETGDLGHRLYDINLCLELVRPDL